jgi:four helix bundle protein
LEVEGQNEEVDEKKNDIYERAFQFAARVQQMEKALAIERRRVNRNSLNQLMSASSSIGSNLQEAKGAQSRADFHAKVHIALKEARESHYWLRLISRSGAAPANRFAPILQEANEIVAILTTIAKKTDPRNPATS